MNKVILIGRLTAEPELRENSEKQVARYRLAVDRRGGKEADFINIVAFDKGAVFASKYLHKGTKIAVTGRITTGSYTDKSGHKVYTFDVIADETEFCESKKAAEAEPKEEEFVPPTELDGLPFN